MTRTTESATAVSDRETSRKKYPEVRLIVLDDDFNTFQHVAECLEKIIPRMSKKKAWSLAEEIDSEGSAEVWRGPLEPAELYHHQLGAFGLTMAPIEQC